MKITSRQYWKISAGSGSIYWKDFVKGGYAALGEYDEGNLSQYIGLKKKLVDRVKDYSLKRWPEAYSEGSTFGYQLWNFLEELEEGDVIVLYGKNSIYALGQVTGAYYYEEFPEGECYYPHRVPVAWKAAYPPIQGLSQQLIYSLIKPPDTFHQIKSQKNIEEVNNLFKSSFLRDFSEKQSNGSQRKTDEQLLREIKEIQGGLEKETRLNKTHKRNRELVRRLKELYNYKCQLCSEPPEIPLIPMSNGTDYIEVHHIKGFNEINEDNKEEVIDQYKNAITVCCYHHKLLHNYRSKVVFDLRSKTFKSKDGKILLPLRINKHLQ